MIRCTQAVSGAAGRANVGLCPASRSTSYTFAETDGRRERIYHITKSLLHLAKLHESLVLIAKLCWNIITQVCVQFSFLREQSTLHCLHLLLSAVLRRRCC